MVKQKSDYIPHCSRSMVRFKILIPITSFTIRSEFSAGFELPPPGRQCAVLLLLLEAQRLQTRILSLQIQHRLSRTGRT